MLQKIKKKKKKKEKQITKNESKLEQQEYEVSKLLDVRFNNNQYEYLVNWAAPYNSYYYNSWEPEINISKYLIRDFKKTKIEITCI